MRFSVLCHFVLLLRKEKIPVTTRSTPSEHRIALIVLLIVIHRSVTRLQQFLERPVGVRFPTEDPMMSDGEEEHFHADQNIFQQNFLLFHGESGRRAVAMRVRRWFATGISQDVQRCQTTHQHRLPEDEENNQFNHDEFRQRRKRFQLFFGVLVERDETVQSDRLTDVDDQNDVGKSALEIPMAVSVDFGEIQNDGNGRTQRIDPSVLQKAEFKIPNPSNVRPRFEAAEGQRQMDSLLRDDHLFDAPMPTEILRQKQQKTVDDVRFEARFDEFHVNGRDGEENGNPRGQGVERHHGQDPHDAFLRLMVRFVEKMSKNLNQRHAGGDDGEDAAEQREKRLFVNGILVDLPFDRPVDDPDDQQRNGAAADDRTTPSHFVFQNPDEHRSKSPNEQMEEEEEKNEKQLISSLGAVHQMDRTTR